MPYSPDSDTTASRDAPDDHAPGGCPEPGSGPRDDRAPGWAMRARTGSAATAVAALAALGGGGLAHAAPAHTAAVAPALVGQQAPEPAVHTVVRGDTLWAIAQRHGVSVAELLRWNDLSGAALLMPGQELRLSGTPEPTAPAPAPSEEAEPQEYVVRPGDSLWGISQQHGVSVQELLEANDLTVNSLLRPGQRLSLGGGAPAAARPAANPAPEPAIGDTFAGRTYDDEVTTSANRHYEQLMARPAPSREEARALVHRTAVDMGVDPALALAHAYQESGFNHRSVSPADAVGVMQVIPAAGDWASGLVGRPLDLLDPQDNITAGVAIIRRLAASTESTDAAIASYYQGLHGVRKYGMYDDTKQYVKNVKAHWEEFAR